MDDTLGAIEFKIDEKIEAVVYSQIRIDEIQCSEILACAKCIGECKVF